MTRTIYIPIPVAERKPDEGKVVIGIWKGEETAARAVVRQESGYWNEAYEGYECDEPDEWLEPQTLPSDGELYVFALKHAIRYLTDEQRLALGRDLLARHGNNGWTKITGPDSLPKEPGLYKWYRSDTETITEFWYDEASQIANYTHYKAVKELPPID